MDVFYTMKGNAVLIHRPITERPTPLTEANIRLAIENVTRQHDDYVTEQAWKEHLTIYEDALAYLLAHAERDSAEAPRRRR